MFAPLLLTGAVLFGFLPTVPAITQEASFNLSGLSEDPNGSQCYEKISPDLANCLSDARQAFLDKSGQFRLGKRGPSYRKTLAKGECVIRQAAIECILKLSCSKCNTSQGAWYKEQTSKLKEECNLQVANVPECADKNAVSSTAATTEMTLGENEVVMMTFLSTTGTITVVGCMLLVARILADIFTSIPIQVFYPFEHQRKFILGSESLFIIILFTASVGVVLLNFLGGFLALFASAFTDNIGMLIFYFITPTGILLLLVIRFGCLIGCLIGHTLYEESEVSVDLPVLPN